MATPWYNFPITQSFGQNGERGVDLGMPVGTPVYAPFGGTVLGRSDNAFAMGAQPAGAGPTAGVYSQTGYNQWGGEVDLLMNKALTSGQQVMYFLHLDQLAVRPGQTIQPGQLIGFSGGENSLGTSNVQPGYSPTHVTLPAFSSGPHIEWGFYNTGANGWQQNANPAGVLNTLRATGGSSNGGNGQDGNSQGGPFPDWLMNLINYGPLAGTVDNTVGPGIANAASNAASTAAGGVGDIFSGVEQSVASWGIHIGLFALALVLFAFGLLLLFWGPVSATAKDAGKAAAAGAVVA